LNISIDESTPAAAAAALGLKVFFAGDATFGDATLVVVVVAAGGLRFAVATD